MFNGEVIGGLSRWHVVRLPAGSSCEAVLLSGEFFSLTTHWNGCTVVCAGDGCALCEILGTRGLWYVAVHAAGQVRMVELGAVSASHLEQHCKLMHGGMRPGLVIRFSRSGRKQPVHSEVLREQAGVQAVPTLKLAAHVMAIYKYPPPNPADDLGSYDLRLRAACQLRNRHLAEQILSAKKTGV